MAAKKKSSRRRSSGRKKASSKRTTIAPRGDKRYVRRSATGRFKESDDAGRSLATDVRKKAKRKSASGQGDKGDRRRKRGS
jgi:hypothetical protein